MPSGMGGLHRIQNAYKEPLDLWFSGNHLGEPTGDPPPVGGGPLQLSRRLDAFRNRERPRRGASGTNPRD